MENERKLPFTVGDLAEARSFQIGFRSAWFRCKIREITKRKGMLGHVSEYYDFPDEKLKWTRLYQVPVYSVGKAKEKHRELMLRSHYPPIYNEKQMPHVSEISEVIVIVNNSWKVGDLVDWWTTGCYWSGRITQLLGDDKAKIELNPPPFGEGSSYEVFLKDVRPSLDWSPEHGWTVPAQDGDTGSPCVRLVKPINQVIGRIAGQEIDSVQVSAGSSTILSYSCPASSNSAASDEVKSTRSTEMQKQSLGTTVSKLLKVEKEKSRSRACGDSDQREKSQADTDSWQNSAEAACEVAEEDLRSSRSHKYTASEIKGATFNLTPSDTLEAAILDLEEYVNKVKWLRKILHYGISSSDAERPQWQFVEPHAATEMPK